MLFWSTQTAGSGLQQLSSIFLYLETCDSSAYDIDELNSEETKRMYY